MTVFERWARRMERVGIGYLRLSAVEFGAMTPLEFEWRLDAEFERENREQERLAQVVCWMVNSLPTGRKSAMTVKQLLKRKKPQAS